MAKKDESNKNACGTGGSAPYAGSGKLTDYKKDGSWMLKQMEKGYDKVDRGISVKKDNNGNIRFAKLNARQHRIASMITASSEEFKISKNYKQLSSTSRNDYRFAVKWSLYGNLDGSTLDDLAIVKNLLESRVNSDMAKLNPAFQMTSEYMGGASIDFSQNCIRIEGIISFQVNIVTDADQITKFLEKLGFESVNAVNAGA